MNQEQLESVMGLIIYSGNAKSDAMEAISAAKKVILMKPLQKSKLPKMQSLKHIIHKLQC